MEKDLVGLDRSRTTNINSSGRQQPAPPPTAPSSIIEKPCRVTSRAPKTTILHRMTSRISRSWHLTYYAPSTTCRNMRSPSNKIPQYKAIRRVDFSHSSPCVSHVFLEHIDANLSLPTAIAWLDERAPDGAAATS